MHLCNLYEQLQIPPNLQRHMQEVTAVGMYVCDHWTGEAIDRELIQETLLLHDLGNIVKFSRPFLGELEAEAQRWARVQDDFVQRYGSRATHATVQILQEINARPEIAEIILDMSPLDSGEIPFERLETRICSFADMSVTPEGIEGFEARMLDLAKRYPTERVQIAMQHERQNAELVQQQTRCNLFELPTLQLQQRAAALATYEIPDLQTSQNS
jgi:hypothetical protein